MATEKDIETLDACVTDLIEFCNDMLKVKINHRDADNINQLRCALLIYDGRRRTRRMPCQG